MKEILMCDPTFFNVDYTINPWMENHLDNVNVSLARIQWSSLYWALSKHCIIRLVKPERKLPDMVFTANAGFSFDKGVILSHFAKEQRKGEEQFFKKWFRDNKRSIFYPSFSYEGEGDHLVDAFNRHWVGSGFRTDPSVKNELESILETKVTILKLVDPRWYHLDTCFCPLPGGEILWYPPAFSIESQNLIRKSFEHSIEISEEDALAFSCNCVCLGEHLFLPKNKSVSDILSELGYIVNDFELTEFMKAGGAAKCLTLHLST